MFSLSIFTMLILVKQIVAYSEEPSVSHKFGALSKDNIQYISNSFVKDPTLYRILNRGKLLTIAQQGYTISVMYILTLECACVAHLLFMKNIYRYIPSFIFHKFGGAGFDLYYIVLWPSPPSQSPQANFSLLPSSSASFPSFDTWWMGISKYFVALS